MPSGDRIPQPPSALGTEQWHGLLGSGPAPGLPFRCGGGGQPLPLRVFRGAKGAGENFDWPQARRKIWPNLGGGGMGVGGGRGGGTPPHGAAELLNGALTGGHSDAAGAPQRTRPDTHLVNALSRKFQYAVNVPG